MRWEQVESLTSRAIQRRGNGGCRCPVVDLVELSIRWEDKVKLRSFSSREREMLKQEKESSFRELYFPAASHKLSQARMQEEKSNVTVFIKDDGQFNTFNDEDEETPSSQQGSGSKQQQDHQLTVKDSPSTASVSFQIQVETQFGDEVYICGSCPELGSWVPAFSKKLMTNKVNLTCPPASSCKT
eukprot:747445-Hanusia_phi.AAC.1